MELPPSITTAKRSGPKGQKSSRAMNAAQAAANKARKPRMDPNNRKLKRGLYPMDPSSTTR